MITHQLKTLGLSLALATGLHTTLVQADTYKIDTQGMHTSIQFQVKHLGYSWLAGRFNSYDGQFTYDPAHPDQSSVTVDIDVKSVDTNHAERDKHLRSPRFFDTDSFPNASFKSTKVEVKENNQALITGDFTLRGITKPVQINAQLIGMGDDPWGGYRAGFIGTTTLNLGDYVMQDGGKLGPASQEVQLTLHVEGIRQ